MICEKSKCIFIHVPKTGGTSIEHCLSINEGDELPKGVHFSSLPIEMQKKYCLGLNSCAQHKTICEYDKAQRDKLFTFGFVRNPWDKAVSEYSFIKQRNPKDMFGVTFENFLTNWIWKKEGKSYNYHKSTQSAFLFGKNRDFSPDFIGSFENLTKDFDYVCSILNIKSRLKKINKSKHKPYQEYFTPPLIDFIGEKYEEDVKRFNYKFQP